MLRMIAKIALMMGTGTMILTASGALGKKWESNKNCEACHQEISKKWKTSRHAHSHFSKNDLFKKSLEYIVRKNPTIILDEVKVKCARCHNPRLTKRHISDEEKVGLLFGDHQTTKHFHSMLDNVTMKNGINCMVCHNIDEIHLDKKKGSGGMKSVKFGPQGVMFGPFADAVSPYHKTKQRAHFVGNKPTLCFVCHYSFKNANGVEVYATGKEYDRFKVNEEGCKDCHMSKKYKGFASNFASNGQSPKARMVRIHRFASVDNSNVLNDYVDVKGSTEGHTFVVTLRNKAPHKVPTGYGLREIILKVTFLDKNDKLLETKQYVLGTQWVDAAGKPTIPHLAVKIAKDTRMDGKSTKAYRFTIPKNAVYATYSFSYRLISKELAKKIGITDPFFLREYTFSQQRVHL
ncbi:hypothetical protein MNB_SV-4-1102 [hydrothermal vent metagenome]|uniref:C2H2-type domain-containing protein n=1 Tax=hydrothermal vent metagenome TaxID=652676 RepID=A0A1W1E8I2_9ZZZZ